MAAKKIGVRAVTGALRDLQREYEQGGARIAAAAVETIDGLFDDEMRARFGELLTERLKK